MKASSASEFSLKYLPISDLLQRKNKQKRNKIYLFFYDDLIAAPVLQIHGD